MKKSILTLIMYLFAIAANSQTVVKPNIDCLEVDSFTTTRGSNLFDLSKLVIAYNEDKTKAIVLEGYKFPWRTNLLYNVKDNKKRTVLWYMDNFLYCGYVYDKETKECQYFESRTEGTMKMPMKKFPRHLKRLWRQSHKEFLRKHSPMPFKK